MVTRLSDAPWSDTRNHSSKSLRSVSSCQNFAKPFSLVESVVRPISADRLSHPLLHFAQIDQTETMVTRSRPMFEIHLEDHRARFSSGSTADWKRRKQVCPHSNISCRNATNPFRPSVFIYGWLQYPSVSQTLLQCAMPSDNETL